MSTVGRAENVEEARHPLLVTFSGLDGSGKSTQIQNVRRYLESASMRVVMLVFWENAVVGTRYRENFVHKVYGSEKGVGSPDRPIQRRDKNMRRWYLSLARHALYFLDAVHLCEVVARARRGNPDVILVDRYIYDELVNLPLRNVFTRMYVRALNALVPKPDLALLLDADPQAARARKPEYPLEFMQSARKAYFKIAALAGRMTVIPPLSLEDAKAEVLFALRRILIRRSRLLRNGADLAAA